MQAFSTQLRYGAVAMLFHWLTVALVLAAFILGPGGSERRVYSSAMDFSRELHETLGIAVFALVLLRIMWRMFDPAPEEPPMERWMKLASQTVHLVLYVLLIALPVTAIAGAWLEGHPVTLLAIGNIGPMLFSEAHALGQTVAELHGILGDIIIWLAGAHAAAALYHHFFLRDRILVSMLPLWRRQAGLRDAEHEIPRE